MAVNLLTPTSLRSSTLSTAGGNEGKKNKQALPSFRLAGERVIQRSADRVSNYTSDKSRTTKQ